MAHQIIRYLIYKGNKQSGHVILKRMRATSPWRKLAYHPGMRLRLGIDIPEIVGELAQKAYPSLFDFEHVELGIEETFKEQYQNLLLNYVDELPINKMFVLMNQVITEAMNEDEEPKTPEKSFFDQLTFLMELFEELSPEIRAEAFRKVAEMISPLKEKKAPKEKKEKPARKLTRR